MSGSFLVFSVLCFETGFGSIALAVLDLAV